MTGIETLSRIKDRDSVEIIRRMTDRMVSRVKPVKVILFGSFAEGTYTAESDYDFYLVIDDDRSVSDATDAAYNAVMDVKNRPVDIVVGTNTRFEARGKSRHSLMVEGEVQRHGILLYDRLTAPARKGMTS